MDFILIEEVRINNLWFQLVDQQMVRARNARRDVVVDQVGHAELIHQAVTGGQLDTGLPFFGRDAVLKARKVGAVVHGGALGQSSSACNTRWGVMSSKQRVWPKGHTRS